MRILWRSSFRYLKQHPGQILLAVIGVAVGVSVIVGIDIAIKSASRGFELSTVQLTGRATHRITGARSDLSEEVYMRLRTKLGLRNCAPLVVETVPLSGSSNPIHLLGVDPFAEPPFRPYLSRKNLSNPDLLKSFMLSDNSGLLDARTAESLGIRAGDTLDLQIQGEIYPISIIGVIKPTAGSTTYLNNLLITDISTAQQALGMQGRLTRIDLILPQGAQGEKLLAGIRKILPPEAEIRPAGTGAGTMNELLRGFNLNLSAVSFLALIVGMFLIYNTMTFSVLRRRQHIGRLKALGVTRREIGSLILSEAVAIGVTGTLIGGFAGYLLGHQLLNLVTRTINDLYFVLNVTNVHLSTLTLVKAIGLGIGGTILATVPPSREATRTSPRITLLRSRMEDRTLRNIPKLAGLGLVILIVGVLLLLTPTRSPLIGYLAMLPVILGFSFLVPLLIRLLVKLIRPLAGRLLGLLGKIALQSIVTQLSRTAVAIAALTVAVSATIAVTTSIESFRHTVIQWLDTTLQSEIYISPQGLVSRRNYTPMDASVLETVRNTRGVTNVTSTRYFQEHINDSRIDIGAIELGPEGYHRYEFKAGRPETFWQEFQTGNTVIVSEPYAYDRNTHVGDTLRIPTDHGTKTFRVLGIYYDYSSDIGTVLLSENTFHKYWTGNGVTGIGLDAREISADSLIVLLRNRLGEKQGMNYPVASHRVSKDF